MSILFSNCIIIDLPIVANTCPLSRTAYLYGLSNRSVICSSSPCAIFSNVSNLGLAPSQMSPIVDFGTPHSSAACLIVRPFCSNISFILIFICYIHLLFFNSLRIPLELIRFMLYFIFINYWRSPNV